MKFKSAAAMLVLCLVLQAQAETLLGKVIHVQDGDSITVLGRNRTIDTRIFNPNYNLVSGVRKSKKRNKFSPVCLVWCWPDRTCSRTPPSRRGASP